MESSSQNQPQTSRQTPSTTSRPGFESPNTLTDRVGTAAQAVREKVEDRGAEIIDQAKQKVTEAYDQANKSVTEQYEKAIDYGRENPGKTTLIAFGVGVGVGVLLVSSLSGSSRSRRSRVVEPVMSAVSTLARELFR
ncbi:MAG: hypothetical protein ABI882_13680 [Acidobacteriota bacterium]